MRTAQLPYSTKGEVVNATILVATITAMVTIAGWFINNVLTARSERNRSRLTAELNHVERQLSELYGPLAFLIYEGQSTFLDLLDNLGRTYVFWNDEPLPESELSLWLFWVDNDLMPRNAAIQELLATKGHLIAGRTMPPSYLDFMKHYNAWRVSHLRWKEEGIKYSYHSKTNWPRQFATDIVATFEELMQRHATLLGAVART
jgi:hypothetical protein